MPRHHYMMMSGSEKFSSLMTQSTSSRFALNIQRSSCSLCNLVNSFLRSKNCWWTLRVRSGILFVPRSYPGLRRQLGKFRMKLPSACENVTGAELLDATFCTRGNQQRDVGHFENIVMCQIHYRTKPSGYIELTVGLITCVCECSLRQTARSQHAKECEQDQSQDVQRCTQERLVRKDDLMECFCQPDLET